MAQLDIKPLDIHPEVCNVYGEDQNICKWMAKFRSGLKQLEDAVHPGKLQQNRTSKKYAKYSRPMQDSTRDNKRGSKKKKKKKKKTHMRTISKIVMPLLRRI